MNCVWFLAGLLLWACCCSAMPMSGSAASPSLCCFSFTRTKINPNLVLSVTQTGSRCSKKGFVVTTPKRKICVGLNQTWIKTSSHD